MTFNILNSNRFNDEVMIKSLSITKISIGNKVVLKVIEYRFEGMLKD